MRKFTLIIILFSLISTKTIGQFSISLDVPNTLTSINACGSTETERFDITYLGAPFSDTVFVYVNLDNGIVFDSLITTSQYDTLSPFDPANPVFFTFDPFNDFLNGDNRPLEIKVSAKCSVIQSGTQNAINDTAYVDTLRNFSTINDQDEAAYTANFNDIQPKTPLAGDNLIAQVLLGTSFTRAIRYTGPLNLGTVEVVDAHDNTYISIDSMWADIPYVDTFYFDKATSTIICESNPANFDGGDLLIYEKVTLKQCIPDSLSEIAGGSILTLRRGCDTLANSFCENAKIVTNAEVTQEDSTAAQLSFVAVGNHRNLSHCSSSDKLRSYVYKNSGEEAAINNELIIGFTQGQSNYGVKDSSVYFVIGIDTFDFNHFPNDIEYDSTGKINRNCADYRSILTATFYVDTLLGGDSIIFNFAETRCCTDQTVGAGYQSFVAYASGETICGDFFEQNHGGGGFNLVRLDQTFNSSITSMNGAIDPVYNRVPDTNWFCIENVIYPFFQLGYFAQDTACITFEFDLDTGLLFTDDTTFYIVTRLGNVIIPNITITGQHMEFTYCFNENESSFAADSLKGAKIFFQVTARCHPEPAAPAFIRESVFLETPDTSCDDPQCRIQMGSVSSPPINITCPGCITPGVVILNAITERVNVGLQDTSGCDRVADTPNTPATNADLTVSTEGDTIETRLFASLFGGIDSTTEAGAITINDLAYQFDHWYYELYITDEPDGDFVISDLDFVDMEIEFRHEDGTVFYTGMYTAEPLVLNSNTLRFALSIDSLGITDTSFFSAFDVVSISHRFKFVDSSFVAGARSLEFKHFMYVSGTADPTNDGTITGAYSSQELELDSSLFFWCEKYSSRITVFPLGIRAEIPSFSNPPSCTKTIRINVFAGISTDFDFLLEHRRLSSVDTICVGLPQGYQFDSAWVRNNVRVSELNTNVGLMPIWISGDSLCFDIGSYYDTLIKDTTCNKLDQNDSLLYQGDAYQYLQFEMNIIPNCTNAEDSTTDVNFTVIFDHEPQVDYQRNTFNIKAAGLQETLTLPNPVIAVDNTRQINVSTSTVCFENIPFNNVSNDDAENFFLYLDPEISKFSDIYVINTVTGDTLLDSVISNFYQQGTLPANTDFAVDICFSYSDCPSQDIPVIEVFPIFYGWNCTGYPESIADNICFLDTVNYIVNPFFSGIRDSLVAQSTDLCDTIDILYFINAEGQGSIVDMEAHLNLIDGVSIADSNTTIIYAGDTIAYVVDTLNPIWVLDSNVHDTLFNPGFNGSSSSTGEMIISFKLVQTACSNYNEIFMNLTGVKYCGDSISTQTFIEPQFDDVAAGFTINGDTCYLVGEPISFIADNQSTTIDHQWGFAYNGGATTFLLADTTPTIDTNLIDTGTYIITHIIGSTCCQDTVRDTIQVVNFCCPTLSIVSIIHNPNAAYPAILVTYDIVIENTGNSDAIDIDIFADLPTGFGTCANPITIVNPSVLLGLSIPSGDQITIQVIGRICSSEEVRGENLIVQFNLVNNDTLCNDTITEREIIHVLEVCPFVFDASPVQDDGCFNVSLDWIYPVDTAVDNGGCIDSIEFCISYPDSLMEVASFPPYYNSQYSIVSATFDTMIADDSLYQYDSRKLLKVKYHFDSCMPSVSRFIDSIKFKLQCGVDTGSYDFVIQDGCGVKLWYASGAYRTSFIDAGHLIVDTPTDPCSGTGTRMEDTSVITINQTSNLMFGHDPFTFEASVKFDFNNGISITDNQVILSNRRPSDNAGVIDPFGFEWYVKSNGLPEVIIDGQIYAPCKKIKKLKANGSFVNIFEPPQCRGVNLLDGQCHNLAVVREIVAWESQSKNGKLNPGGGSEKLVFYIDGIQIGKKVNIQKSQIIDHFDYTTARWKIGNNRLYETGMIGDLDGVRMWNISHTGAELISYEDSVFTFPTTYPFNYPLMGFWTFNEEFVSQSVIDSTPNFNHGILGTGINTTNNDPKRIDDIDCNVFFPRMANDDTDEKTIKVAVSPNPYTNSTTINIEVVEELRNEKVIVQIFAIQGNELVFEKNVVGNSTISIQDDLVSGVYILKVSSATETRTIKLVRVK